MELTGNKKILETDYPRGRAIEVFCRFHFGLGAKNQILYFAPPGITKRQFRPPRRGGEIRKPQGRAIGELFRFKIPEKRNIYFNCVL